MNKEIVTQGVLAEFLEKEIQKIPGLETCRVTGIAHLQEYDTDGCNWSDM